MMMLMLMMKMMMGMKMMSCISLRDVLLALELARWASAHISMVADMLRAPRHFREPWLDFSARRFREARAALKESGLQDTAALAMRRLHPYAGHLARLDPHRALSAALRFKDQHW